MQKYNNWGVPFSTICFFERALNTHRRVINVSRERDIFFRVKRDDRSNLNILLLNEYRFGIASLMRALAEFSDAQYIVIGGEWNEYTEEAMNYAKDNNIGIYNFSEFLGALNYNNIPLQYIKKDDRDSRRNTNTGA